MARAFSSNTPKGRIPANAGSDPLAPYLDLISVSGKKYFELRPLFESGYPRFLLPAEKAARIWKKYLDLNPESSPNLYIHIPYCRSRCAYCMYHSDLLAPGALDGHLKYLAAEAGFYAPALENAALANLYVGGGTPSLLAPGQVRSFFALIAGLYRFRKAAGKTFELSLSDVNPELLASLKDAGFNRISVGVQSLSPAVLRAANRPSYPKPLSHAVELIKSFRFPWINLDIITGLEKDTERSLLGTLSKCLETRPTQITLYIRQVQDGLLRERTARPAALSGRLAETAAVMAGRLGFSMDATPKSYSFTRPAGECEALKEALSLMFGQDNPVLGLGRYSYSSLPGIIHYTDMAVPGAESLEGTRYSAMLRSKDMEIRRFMTGAFIENGWRVPARAFKRRFGVSPLEYFGTRIKALLDRKIAVFRAGVLSFPAPGTEASTAGLLYLADRDGKVLRRFLEGTAEPLAPGGDRQAQFLRVDLPGKPA